MKEESFGSVLEVRFKGEAASTFNGREGKRVVLEAASLVSRYENSEFERVLPLEAQPAIATAEELSRELLKTVYVIASRFVKMGYILGEIKRTGCYRYVREVGEQGYQSFYKFCKDFYGLSDTDVKRLVLINERFCDCGMSLVDPAYERFSMSQLAEMASYKAGLEAKLPPACSVRKMARLRRYYSSLDWKVSPKTTWQEDLAKCEHWEQDEEKRKRDKLKKFKFEKGEETRQRQSGKSSVKQGKAVNVFKDYDAFLLASDQSAELFKDAEKKCPALAPYIAEILTVLSKTGQEVRAAKSREIFADFTDE